jgi:hypothetical protein
MSNVTPSILKFESPRLAEIKSYLSGSTWNAPPTGASGRRSDIPTTR